MILKEAEVKNKKRMGFNKAKRFSEKLVVEFCRSVNISMTKFGIFKGLKFFSILNICVKDSRF